MQIFHEYS